MEVSSVLWEEMVAGEIIAVTGIMEILAMRTVRHVHLESMWHP
jgi:hypothetical protein